MVWDKLTFSELPLCKFKKFVSGSVTGKLTHAGNFKASCYDLKIRGLGKNCVRLYSYVLFLRHSF